MLKRASKQVEQLLFKRTMELWQSLNLTPREKTYVIVGLVVVSAVLVVQLVISAVDIIDSQSARLRRKEMEFKRARIELARHKILKTRLQKIENALLKRNSKVGVRSYLENILKKEGSLSSTSYSIRQGKEKPLGKDYVISQYHVTFAVNSYDALVRILKKLRSDGSPIIVSRINITKPWSADRLIVNLEVISVSNAKA